MAVNDHDADIEFDDDRPPPRPIRPVDERGSLRPLLYLLAGGFAIGLVIVGVWLAGELVTRLRNGRPPATDPQAQLRVATPAPSLDAEESEAVNVFKAARDSVVNVDLVLLQRNRLDGQMLERQTGGGSGFVWDADGRIVTNYHVIEDAVKRKGIALRVVMADRTAFDARVVGTAPDYDLAVVQITAPKEKLKPITLGTSRDLEVGRKVFAIGNPFGLSLTMTTGIISNVDRSIESPSGAPITGAIQHSAQINPGNSGGPLLDRVGRLIGVNTSITTPSGGNVGIGFAIPADTVNQVVTEIIRTGRSARPDLGVRLYDQNRMRRAGSDRGVMIAEVIPGGPAEKAQLRGLHRNPETGRVEPGDVILAINGEEVVGVDEFQQILAKLKPGDKVKVRYMRDEDEHETTLTVQGV
jgi:S1-C subfamily serine protease